MGGNAEVSSNNVTSASAVLGGGISIKNGNVMMTGGTVSGNKAVSTTSSSGGGLAQSGGSFVMTGGTIYGRPADDNDLLGNTAVSGAAYYRSGTGGTATPELDSSIDTTITDGVAAEDTTSDDQ
jgi:hypothetical protein